MFQSKLLISFLSVLVMVALGSSGRFAAAWEEIPEGPVTLGQINVFIPTALVLAGMVRLKSFNYIAWETLGRSLDGTFPQYRNQGGDFTVTARFKFEGEAAFGPPKTIEFVKRPNKNFETTLEALEDSGQLPSRTLDEDPEPSAQDPIGEHPFELNPQVQANCIYGNCDTHRAGIVCSEDLSGNWYCVAG